MKSLFIAALLSLASFGLKAQTVNDLPIKDIDVDYVQIVGTSRMLSNKLTIEIDFGQENKFFSSDKDTRVKDSTGKNMIFNSMIDALNFMTRNGYEFVQAYTVTVSNQNVYHYLLRKKRGS
ncbi:MAG: hypothetical protein EOP49_46540 [Sphingobacteriales bacterium]|nr:MAG: hypothetical protein EOP49_46540 [Sphingobacteriales bacterium]